MIKITSHAAIAQLGAAVLRQVAQPVIQVHAPEIQVLIERLMTTMYENQGVGIAAPQLGASLQVLIVSSRPTARYPQAPTMAPVVMVNPEVVASSADCVRDWEGCLSIPGIRGLVPRTDSIQVRYCDRDGIPQELTLSGFPARIFQHEYDHLRGLVFLDRVETTCDLFTEHEYQKRMDATAAAR